MRKGRETPRQGVKEHGAEAGDSGEAGSGGPWSFWRRRARAAAEVAGTPVLVFAEEPLETQARRLMEAFAGMPVRHWWSFKTLPLLAAVRVGRRLGFGVEVVSEYELRSVLALGVPPADILVNGPAKQAWLPRTGVAGLWVNFDSPGEVESLATQAVEQAWRVGLRLNTRSEENFEYPGVRTQFGLVGSEVRRAVARLRRAGKEPDVLHFHLRTQVPEARLYREAAEEALERAAEAGWRPTILDLGGGFPVERVETRKGAPWNAGFSMARLRESLAVLRNRHPNLAAIWMENGRWLASPTGVLVVRVLEAKEGRGARTLVCDGGRTLQAMVATWERHAMIPLPARHGRAVRTLVCGPTCMAFDNLGLHDLPSTVRCGDRLIWMDAGAYQTSWETRFSHGLGAVVWTAGKTVEVIRPREAFEEWNRGR